MNGAPGHTPRCTKPPAVKLTASAYDGLESGHGIAVLGPGQVPLPDHARLVAVLGEYLGDVAVGAVPPLLDSGHVLELGVGDGRLGGVDLVAPRDSAGRGRAGGVPPRHGRVAAEHIETMMMEV